MLCGARQYAPALALSLLAPKLAWSEAETAAGVRQGALVHRADGEPLSPHDLARLQVQGRAGLRCDVCNPLTSVPADLQFASVCRKDTDLMRPGAAPGSDFDWWTPKQLPC